MNQALSWRTIVIVLIPFALLLYGYLWSLEKTTQINHPIILKETPWHTLSLPLKEGQLFEFNAQGQLIRQLDLKTLGIEQATGEVEFLSQDEILVYGGKSPLSFGENLESFARIKPDDEFSNQEGLLRCNLYYRSCEPFTRALPNIKGAFHMAWDFEHKQLYLTNTRAHVLYRFDEHGNVLDQSPADALKFPNHIYIQDGKLWLIDTNHKQAKAFGLGDAGLETPEVKFNIQQDENCGKRSSIFDLFRENPKCWPGTIAPYQSEQTEVWVSVMENGMDNGVVHRYTPSGSLIEKLNLANATQHLNLPFPNDPTSMVQNGDTMIIMDFNNLTLLQYNPLSKTATALTVPELEEALQPGRDKKVFYRTVGNGFIGGFFLLLVVGFAVALKDHFKQQNQKIDIQGSFDDSDGNNHSNVNKNSTPDFSALALPQPPTNPFWFSPAKIVKQLRLLFIICSVLVVLSIIPIVVMSEAAGIETSFIMLTMLLSIFIPGWFVIQIQFNKRLGISGRLLMVANKNKPTAMAPLHEVIKVGERGILVEDTLFNYCNNSQHKLINKEEFERYLEPRLKNMKQISEWEYMKLRWQQRHKESLMMCASMIPALIMIAYMSFRT